MHAREYRIYLYKRTGCFLTKKAHRSGQAYIYVYVVECNYIVTSDKIFSLMIDIVSIRSTWPNRRDGNEELEGRGERHSKRRPWSSVRVVSKWSSQSYIMRLSSQPGGIGSIPSSPAGGVSQPGLFVTRLVGYITYRPNPVSPAL